MPVPASPFPRRAAAALAAAIAVSCWLGAPPSRALDLFAGHEVTAQFANPSGKPMANAEVRVFAPGNSTTPAETGRTDAAGKFAFDADRDGLWNVEARTADEVARVTLRVGGESQQKSRIPPFVVIGALIVLVALAWYYRLLRARNRRREH